MRMDDGFSTTVTFAENGAVKLWEKSVTPPGLDGGGANETTTMRNTARRTKAPKKLSDLTDMKMTCAYDPAVYDDIKAMLQVNQLVTVNFPDGSTLAFWGWLDKFEPGDISEGAQPTADVTIIPSNQDSNGDEIEEDYTAGP